MLTRTISYVYENPKSHWLTVKFGDGSECMAAPDHGFEWPIEVGAEGVAQTEQKETNGRVWDMLVSWREHTASDVSVAAQAPIVTKAGKEPAKAPVRPALRFESRDLSIMAQVALKAAVEARNASGQMNPKGFETDAATVKRAKVFLSGMLCMMQEEWQRQ